MGSPATPEPIAEPAEEEEEASEEPVAEAAPAIEQPTSPPPPPTPPPQATADGSASVQFMITTEMKQKLRALGYSEDDMDQLKPDRARVIIDRALRRTSKLPASWTREAKRMAPIVEVWRSVKRSALANPAGAGAAGFGALAAVSVSCTPPARPSAPRKGGSILVQC